MNASLVAGAAFGLAGLLVSLGLFPGAAGEGWAWMVPASGLAAGAVGAVLWSFLVPRAAASSARRGAGVGAAVGLLAHPVAWYLFLVAAYVLDVRSSLGETTMNPVQGLAGAIVLSAWSLLLAGWITVPLGALVGAALARRR